MRINYLKQYPKVVKYQLKRFHVIYANTALHLFVSDFSCIFGIFLLICNYCYHLDVDCLTKKCFICPVCQEKSEANNFIAVREYDAVKGLKMLDCNQLPYSAIDISYSTKSFYRTQAAGENY